MKSVEIKLESLYDASTEELRSKKNAAILLDLLDSLNNGEIRSASKNEDGIWHVHQWVKRGILLLFRAGILKDYSDGTSSFYDKDTLPLKTFSLDSQVRIVPGGSSIRTGCYIAPGVICMPPMYINIGAYIDSGTMIDSHALVGTCAQIGKNVHISAAAQIGGVLEPAGARPVIIEDDVMIGGNCGVYEGVLIRKRAVLGSGVIINGSTHIYDIVKGEILSSKEGNTIEIPENAVVIP
jgi:2,3,4,5-tetrahydropyridine-2-carboxylate N-succinyltransferase